VSKEPVVERQSSDGQSDDLTGRALRLRIRQQELLAELGVLALQGTSFIEMLNHTARVTAEGLGAEYCKVMEYIPAENRLLVRAGVGWGNRRGRLGLAGRLCLAHGQARNFQPSRKRATISYARVARRTRHSSCDECHFAR